MTLYIALIEYYQSCNKKEMFKIKIKTKILGLKIKIKIGSLKIKIENKIFTCQAQDSKLCDHTAKTSKFKDCMLSDANMYIESVTFLTKYY